MAPWSMCGAGVALCGAAPVATAPPGWLYARAMGGGPQRNERQDILVFSAFMAVVLIVAMAIVVGRWSGNASPWIAVGAIGAIWQAAAVSVTLPYIAMQVRDARSEASRQHLLSNLAVLERVLVDQLVPAIRNLEWVHQGILSDMAAAESAGLDNGSTWYRSHPQSLLVAIQKAQIAAEDASHDAHLVWTVDPGILLAIGPIVSDLEHSAAVCHDAVGTAPDYDPDDPPSWATEIQSDARLPGFSRIRPLIASMTKALDLLLVRVRELRAHPPS